MAKKVKAMVKLQVLAGKATPAPPIGPALGVHGVNIVGFCQQFNERTKNQQDLLIPVVITVYIDRSFKFITKTPTTSFLLKRAAQIAKGSGDQKVIKVGNITKQQLKEIAKIKMPDLNTINVEAAMKIIEGTAKSMGIAVD